MEMGNVVMSILVILTALVVLLIISNIYLIYTSATKKARDDLITKNYDEMLINSAALRNDLNDISGEILKTKEAIYEIRKEAQSLVRKRKDNVVNFSEKTMELEAPPYIDINKKLKSLAQDKFEGKVYDIGHYI